MASRVLSIEINPIVTRICEVEGRKKNPKVYDNFMIKTPQGTVTDGMLQPDGRYMQSLRGALAEHRVKAKKVVFTITSTRIATREVVIPFVKENKIGDLVAAKAEEYFPVDLADYRVAYSLLGTLEDEKGKKRYKVMVLAVPVKMLEGYYELASSCGLEVAALDYMGNSLFQAVKTVCPEGTSLVAKIDEKSTMLMVIQDGSLVSIRNVTYGVAEAIQTIRDDNSREDYRGSASSYYGAVRELRENTYITTDKGVFSDNVVKDVTTSLDYLINGIARVIDFHNPRSNGHPIEKMFITGLGGSFSGMKDLMEDRLGIPISVISDIDGLTLPREFSPLDLGDYIACIGAAMKPLDLVLNAKKEKKGGAAAESGSGRDNTGLAVIVCAGGVIIALALVLSAMLPYKAAQAERDRLANRIEELKPVENVYNTYIAAQGLWTDAENMYALTENHNDDLIAFIQELEQKMPADIMVLSLLASSDNITLNINVNTKASAAKVIQELDAFESISVVRTDGLTDTKEEDGTHVVSFTLNCIYNGEAETDVAAGSEAAAQPADPNAVVETSAENGQTDAGAEDPEAE